MVREDIPKTDITLPQDHPGQVSDNQEKGTPARDQQEILTNDNLLYESEDIQVYVVDGDVDVEQLYNTEDSSEEFTKRSDWRVTRQLQEKDALIQELSARLVNTEQRLNQLEIAVTRMQELLDTENKS